MFKSGKPFGAISLPDPTSVKVKGIVDEAATNLQAGLRALNDSYLKTSYELVFKSYLVSIQDRLNNLVSQFNALSTDLSNDFRNLFQSVPKALIDLKVLECVLFNALFCMWNSRNYMEYAYLRLSHLEMAKALKRQHGKDVLQAAKDDLMDVDTNVEVIRDVIRKTVTEMLPSVQAKGAPKAAPSGPSKAPPKVSPRKLDSRGRPSAPPKAPKQPAQKTASGTRPRGNSQATLKKTGRGRSQTPSKGGQRAQSRSPSAKKKKKVTFAGH